MYTYDMLYYYASTSINTSIVIRLFEDCFLLIDFGANELQELQVLHIIPVIVTLNLIHNYLTIVGTILPVMSVILLLNNLPKNELLQKINN